MQSFYRIVFSENNSIPSFTNYTKTNTFNTLVKSKTIAIILNSFIKDLSLFLKILFGSSPLCVDILDIPAKFIILRLIIWNNTSVKIYRAKS